MPVYTWEYAQAVGFWLTRNRPGEVDFIDGYAKRLGGPILELTSGAARVTRELARRGHIVYGVEMSRPMLAKAQEVVARLPGDVRGRIRLVQGDMRNFAFLRTFPLICIPFYSFWHNLSEEEEAEACVRCMLEHLAPGGCFLVEGERDDEKYLATHGFWQQTAQRLGFRYRSEPYRQLPTDERTYSSFLVGWRP